MLDRQLAPRNDGDKGSRTTGPQRSERYSSVGKATVNPHPAAGVGLEKKAPSTEMTDTSIEAGRRQRSGKTEMPKEDPTWSGAASALLGITNGSEGDWPLTEGTNCEMDGTFAEAVVFRLLSGGRAVSKIAEGGCRGRLSGDAEGKGIPAGRAAKDSVAWAFTEQRKVCNANTSLSLIMKPRGNNPHLRAQGGRREISDWSEILSFRTSRKGAFAGQSQSRCSKVSGEAPQRGHKANSLTWSERQ